MKIGERSGDIPTQPHFVRLKPILRSRRLSRIGTAFVSFACLPAVRAEVAPQDDLQCGVVDSLFSRPPYGPWTGMVPSAMGGAEWNHMIFLTYAPFVVVTNNTGWTLDLNGGGNGQRPRMTFDQPELGLEFNRVGDTHDGFVMTSPVDLDRMYVHLSGTANTFDFTLYGGGSPPTGFKSLAPGEPCVFTPYIPSSATFDTVLDWQNSLTYFVSSLGDETGTMLNIMEA